MSKLLSALFAVCVLSQSALAQPAELQLAEDSRTLARDERTAAKDSRIDCENLALSAQAWIVVVAPISIADAISFQSTLNVINKTRPTRSETEGEIEYSQAFENLVNARLMWQATADEEATRELANMAIESYAEATGIFTEVKNNNEMKIQLLKGLIFHIQEFLGVGAGERSFA